MKDQNSKLEEGNNLNYYKFYDFTIRRAITEEQQNLYQQCVREIEDNIKHNRSLFKHKNGSSKRQLVSDKDNPRGRGENAKKPGKRHKVIPQKIKP